MDPAVRRTISQVNPLLIESWCLKCGVFIAASNDLKKLATAEGSHPCFIAPSKSDREEAGLPKAASAQLQVINPAPEKQRINLIKPLSRKDREKKEAS